MLDTPVAREVQGPAAAARRARPGGDRRRHRRSSSPTRRRERRSSPRARSGSRVFLVATAGIVRDALDARRRDRAMTRDLDIVIVSYNTRDGVAGLPRLDLRRAAVRASTASSSWTTRQRTARVEPIRRGWPAVRRHARSTATSASARPTTSRFGEPRAPLVLLLNSDTIVPAGAIDTLADRLDATGAVAAGPRLVDAHGRPELSFGPMLTPLGELRQRVRGRLAASAPARSARRAYDALLARRADGRLGHRRVPARPARRASTPRASSTSATSCTRRTSISAPRCAPAADAMLFTPAAEVMHLRGGSIAARAAGRARRRTTAATSRSTRSTRPRWAPLLRGWLRPARPAHPIESSRSTVRIAIDARKLHDYGIGTYVRNLVRWLSRARTATTRTCCSAARPTRTSSASLGPRFEPLVERRGQLLGARAGQRAARRCGARASICSTRRTTSSRRSRRARSSSRFTTASICGFRSICRTARRRSTRACDDGARRRGARGACSPCRRRRRQDILHYSEGAGREGRGHLQRARRAARDAADADEDRRACASASSSRRRSCCTRATSSRTRTSTG